MVIDQDIKWARVDKVGTIMGVVGIMLINGEEFLCVISQSEEVSII